MRDKVKRFISILMTALMLVNLMPVGALAEGFTISNSVQSIWESPGYPVFVYVQVDGDRTGLKENKDGWFTIGMIANVKGMPDPQYGSSAYQSSIEGTNGKTIRPEDIIGNITRFTDNGNIQIEDISWKGKGFKVDIGTSGSYSEYNSGKRWHLDGTIKIQNMPSTYIVRYVDVDDDTEIGRGETVTGKMHQTKKVWVEAPDSLKDGLYSFCDDVKGYPQEQVQEVPFTDQEGTLTFYYKKNTYTVNYYLNGTTEKVKPSTTNNANLGNTVFVTHDDINGYTITPESKTVKSVTITKGTNEINFYYYKNVTLTAKSKTATYDGTPKSISGFTGAPKGVTFEGITEPSASGTDAGTYVANFPENPVGKVDTSEKYIVTEANPGTLKINKRSVTLTSATDSKKYDGTPLTNHNVTVGGDGFVKGQGATYNVTGSQTVVGSSENTFGYALKEGTNPDNYDITKKLGKLTVTPVTDKVTVTITGNTASEKYDGSEKTVTGYDVAISNGKYKATDFRFNGTNSVTQTNAGTYPMGLKVSDFENTSDNFTNVEFVVNDGGLTITPAEVTLTAKSATVPYTGQEQGVSGYDCSVEGLTFEGITAGATGTLVGEYTATFNTNPEDPEFPKNKLDTTGNYIVKEAKPGKLTITPVTDKVTVTITGHKDTQTYNGNSHKVEGYDVSTSNTLYTAADFEFNGTDSVTQTTAGTYPMGLTATDFKNTSKNFTNVEFVVNDGGLTITPAEVTLTAKSATKTYNGQEQGVSGYDCSVEGLTFEGIIAGAKGTNVGEYPVTFNTNPEDPEFPKNKLDTTGNYIVKEAKPGKLTITPVTDKVTVTITENSGTEKYDGTEKTVTGYTVSISNPLYKESDFTFSGNAEAKGTDAGKYDMELKASDFTNNNTNFAEVKFVIVDGQLVIEKRNVTLTSASASKTYDGKPLTNDTVAVGGDGFAEGEGATYNVTGTVTEVKDSPATNTFTYTLNDGTKAKNYNIELALGKLEVTPVTEEVIVTITGRTDEMPYDGKEHSVFGYDLTVSNALYNPKEDMQFNGIDGDMTAKGTDANTYPMGLTAEDFENKSKNFSKVTFVVTDGYVKINPRAVTLTSETAGKTYDGTALEKPVVTVGGDGFVEGQVTEIKATGSVTNAGSVANTITFTPNKETFKEGNYAITKTEGTLTINKRSVLITSQSATKTYDGSALTRPAVTITGDGFVPGELAKAEATGSITNVGSTPNAIQYTTTGAFNAANYSIALSVGTLTVTERPQPEPRRTFNLTISYVYQNGKRAAASYNRGGLKNGETFDITSPVIAGYTASETVVSGTIYNRDIKVTVIYTADGVNLDDYGVPLGLGNITMNVGDCFE